MIHIVQLASLIDINLTLICIHSKNRWVEIIMNGYFNLKMHVLK